MVCHERACISILYHAMENTVDKTVNAARMMGWLDVIASNIQRFSCILIGCISFMPWCEFWYYALIEMMMIQYDTER